MKISYFKNTRLFTSIYLVLTFLAFLSFTGCTEEIVEVKVEEKFCLNEFMKDNVDVETVTSLPVTETIHLTGNVEYNPDHVVEFISFVGGVIANTYFTLGDAVKKGQLLAEIESTELSSLLAQKKSHQAQILVAKRAYESSITLYEDEIVSEKDLIESKSNLDVLIAELENTEAQLNMYSASNERGVFQIKAPSSGTIVVKNISKGMQIPAGSDALFTVANLNEVWIMADVYAGNVPFIKQGMKVTIDAIAYPNKLFDGKINSLSRVFDAENRVLKARIVMNNSDNKLMPGMFVDVMVDKKMDKMASAVPSSALLFDNNQHFLLIYNHDCEIEARAVEPIAQNSVHVFFDNNLEVGEKVITKNNLLIYNKIKK